MGTRGHRPSEPFPHGISLPHKDLSLVGTMGTMFSCVSLVEKHEFSLHKRIILPILPRLPALPGETFLSRYVFF